MRKLGMDRLADVEKMTLTEFYYKKHAQDYKEIDDEYRLHKLAFLIRNAAATKNTGTEKKPKEEYVFKSFESFFDYEQILQQLEGGQDEKPEEKPEEKKQLSPAEMAAARNRKG